MNAFRDSSKILILFIVLLRSVDAFSAEINTYNLSPLTLDGFKQSTLYMNYSRAYMGKRMAYRVIPLYKLLLTLRVKPTQIVEFIANDNFSVFIPAKLLLNRQPSKSIAYLAVELATKWPILKNGTHRSAGPYQIIWVSPEKSHISDEYWAWSVMKLSVHQGYPKEAMISPPHTSDPRVINGYSVYISHCASCHTINHIGKGKIGPDLNRPKNPIDYYPSRKKLSAFIRHPKQFRPGRMSGSSETGLRKADLNDLISYFIFMKKNET